MQFSVLAALVGGLVATVVMEALMVGAKQMGMTRMPPMALVSGTMMSGARGVAWGVGAMVHFIVMGTVIFGLAYGGLFTAFGAATWWIGALIGLAHGLVVGTMAMPMMPAAHPRMQTGSPGQEAIHPQPDGTVQLTAPGVMGKEWGEMTPMGLVVGHIVYGLVLATVYAALV